MTAWGPACQACAPTYYTRILQKARHGLAGFDLFGGYSFQVGFPKSQKEHNNFRGLPPHTHTDIQEVYVQL